MRTIANAAAAGAVVSIVLFLFSWWAHAFDELVIFQLPGFWIASLLWGFPGFPHYTPTHRGSFLFPNLMVAVNTVFYGLFVCVFLLFVMRTARSED
jgi:hypothetical protein